MIQTVQRCLSLLFLSSLLVRGFLMPSTPSRFRFSSSSTKEKASGIQRHYAHSPVVSPLIRQEEFLSGGQNNHPIEEDDEVHCMNNLTKISNLLQAKPKNLLRLQPTEDGVRGVYLNRPVREGDIIFSIPLSSCLTDDSPPSWLTAKDVRHNPNKWATRLSASLIDLQLRKQEGLLDEGRELWLSLLPDEGYLRASLPVHWPEDILDSARCTALELAVDRSYFARAEATEDLIDALDNCSFANGLQDEQLRDMCSNALDLVQTRTCRPVPEDDNLRFNLGPPLRVLAPVFDFINHGSAICGGGSVANAEFGLESSADETHIFIRAKSNLKEGEEILLDYGESARPAWNCLASYGFVPQQKLIPAPGQSTTDDDDDENLAEIYMNGLRFEVSPSAIPLEMVAAASASFYAPPGNLEGEAPEEEEVALSAEVALRIARRMSDFAYHLLLEPERDMYDDHPAATPTPFQVISNKLAASLRHSQHRILLRCALGLRDFATEENSYL